MQIVLAQGWRPSLAAFQGPGTAPHHTAPHHTAPAPGGIDDQMGTQSEQVGAGAGWMREDSVELCSLTGDLSVLKCVRGEGYGTEAAALGQVAALRMWVSEVSGLQVQEAHDVDDNDDYDDDAAADDAVVHADDSCMRRRRQDARAACSADGAAAQDGGDGELTRGVLDVEKGAVSNSGGARQGQRPAEPRLLFQRGAGQRPFLVPLSGSQGALLAGETGCDLREVLRPLPRRVRCSVLTAVHLGVPGMLVGELACVFVDLEQQAAKEAAVHTQSGCAHSTQYTAGQSSPSQRAAGERPCFCAGWFGDVCPGVERDTCVEEGAAQNMLAGDAGSSLRGAGGTGERRMVQVEMELLGLDMACVTADGAILARIEHESACEGNASVARAGALSHPTVADMPATHSRLWARQDDVQMADLLDKDAADSHTHSQQDWLPWARHHDEQAGCPDDGCTSPDDCSRPRAGDNAVISYKVLYRGQVLLDLRQPHEVKLGAMLQDQGPQMAWEEQGMHADMPPGLEVLVMRTMRKGSTAVASLEGYHALGHAYAESTLLGCGERIDVELSECRFNLPPSCLSPACQGGQGSAGPCREYFRECLREELVPWGQLWALTPQQWVHAFHTPLPARVPSALENPASRRLTVWRVMAAYTHTHAH